LIAFVALAADSIRARYPYPTRTRGEPLRRGDPSTHGTAGYLDTARVAFQPLWNLVGRPAVMLPWDLDPDGLPTAVQLGARPADEKLLLSLAGQAQEARRWADRRPPVDR
jgi:Asp-tRNA(Asn)/Glu-tRNA(Gln) amidotransferase A subunit family amidase